MYLINNLSFASVSFEELILLFNSCISEYKPVISPLRSWISPISLKSTSPLLFSDKLTINFKSESELLLYFINAFNSFPLGVCPALINWLFWATNCCCCCCCCLSGSNSCTFISCTSSGISSSISTSSSSSFLGKGLSLKGSSFFSSIGSSSAIPNKSFSSAIFFSPKLFILISSTLKFLSVSIYLPLSLILGIISKSLKSFQSKYWTSFFSLPKLLKRNFFCFKESANKSSCSSKYSLEKLKYSNFISSSFSSSSFIPSCVSLFLNFSNFSLFVFTIKYWPLELYLAYPFALFGILLIKIISSPTIVSTYPAFLFFQLKSYFFSNFPNNSLSSLDKVVFPFSSSILICCCCCCCFCCGCLGGLPRFLFSSFFGCSCGGCCSTSGIISSSAIILIF